MFVRCSPGGERSACKGGKGGARIADTVGCYQNVLEELDNIGLFEGRASFLTPTEVQVGKWIGDNLSESGLQIRCGRYI